MSAVLRAWPGRERREPALSHHGYLVLKPLRETLESARDRYITAGSRILDVGAGVMPYYPLFADVADEYVGNDLEPGHGITSVSPVEDLDVEDASFDVVLCTQVLEHVRRPDVALMEMTRVLKPGGHLLLTTHGVYPYHPNPNDYWRWTQQGLAAIVEDCPELELIELIPHSGAPATLLMLMAGAIHEFSSSVRARWLSVPLIASLNAVGRALDRATPDSVRMRLINNFLLVARRSENAAAAPNQP